MATTKDSWVLITGASSGFGEDYGYSVLRMMIDSAPALQQQIPNGAAADKFLTTTRMQAEVDPILETAG
jgi:hypothetical protein